MCSAGPERTRGSSGTPAPPMNLTSQSSTWARAAFRTSLSEGASSPFLTLTRSSRENRWSSSVRWLGTCSNAFNALPGRKHQGLRDTHPLRTGAAGVGVLSDPHTCVSNSDCLNSPKNEFTLFITLHLAHLLLQAKQLKCHKR